MSAAGVEQDDARGPWRARLRRRAGALLLAAATGCASPRGGAPAVSGPAGGHAGAALAATGGCTPSDLAACQALYASARRDTMYPRPARISTSLAPLQRSTEGLVWNERGQVLMATWTNARYYAARAQGDSFALYGDTWFTAVPAVQRACHALAPHGIAWTELRLRQLLGLPPDAAKDAFVQVWVDLKSVFRPCPDPSVFDRECQVDLPMAGDAQAGAGPPWSFCRDADGVQVSSFENVSPAHLRWMCANWCTNYCGGDAACTCTQPAAGSYPWTALGYTYDWGRPDAPQGLSEYIVPAGTPVVFESVASTAAYCSTTAE